MSDFQMRPPLLFLAHRIPYPPNKGDKIRSFHLLRGLAQRYRVYLGAFVDDLEDLRHANALKELCVDVKLIALKPTTATLKSIGGLINGTPLTVHYYRSNELRRWVHETVATAAIRHAFAFSSAMAQYLEGLPQGHVRRIIDFVDVDSEKWRQYARMRRWPMSAVYGREGRSLLAYERRVATSFDASLFVSEPEERLFRDLAPKAAERVHSAPNGVDAEFFSPHRNYPRPYEEAERAIVFTGAMDYWANVDAVCWFAHEIFPRIRAQVPQARFVIVGARPTPQVRALERLAAVSVTGRVQDVRPYLAHAHLAVAPLRVARGVQNKVLEAMAMGRPILASPEALEGIGPAPDAGEIEARGAEQFAERAIAHLQPAKPGQSPDGRDWVVSQHSWESSLEKVIELVAGRSPSLGTRDGLRATLGGGNASLDGERQHVGAI